MKKKNMIDYLVPLGIILIFLGVIIVLVGSILMSGQQKSPDNKSKVHVGVGGFIGPIPFGFANSKTMLYVIIGAAIFFFILWIILRSTG
jgi:uncharacterized protein (TIGR00304 family)